MLFQLGSKHSHELHLDAIKTGKSAYSRRPEVMPRTSQPNAEHLRDPTTRDFCDHAPRMGLDCPARSSVCNLCKKNGQFAKICRLRNTKQPKHNVVQLLAVGAPAKATLVNVTVGNTTVPFKVYSGAQVSVAPSDFPALPAQLEKVGTLLTGPRYQPLYVLGSCLAQLQWQRKTSTQHLAPLHCPFAHCTSPRYAVITRY